MPATRKVVKVKPRKNAEAYQHPEADLLMRPEVGTQAQFKKKKGPKKYRYDSALSPELEWDGQNPAREAGEKLIQEITEIGLRLAELAGEEASAQRDKELKKLKEELKEAQSRLRKISGPFLNWSGKAERMSFDVPTLPLFVHERLPDFIVRLNTAEERYLVLETKGYDPLEEVKKAAAERWVKAVNADGKFGQWRFKMLKDPTGVRAYLDTL